MLLACAGDPDRGRRPGGGPTADTDAGETARPPDTDADSDSVETADTAPAVDTGPGPPVTIAAACAPDASNTLRFWCDVHVEPAQPVQIHFAASGGGVHRVHTSDVVSTDHQIGLYIMQAETVYDFVVTSMVHPEDDSATGTVTTGPLPDSARLLVDVIGTSSAPLVGITTPCATHAVGLILTTQGDVVWYQPFDMGNLPRVEGVTFTEDRSVMLMTGSHLQEFDLMGQLGIDLYLDDDYPLRIHHDAFRRDGRTWVVFNDPVDIDGTQYDLDGFYVFDENGVLEATWRLQDHFLPPNPEPFPVPIDYTHANAIFVHEDGRGVFSLRHLSGVVSMDADPDSPTFGALHWRMSGDPDMLDLGTDFRIETALKGVSRKYRMQHNTHLLPDGRLAFFDNRTLWFENARMLLFDLDEKAGVATITGAWEVPEICDFQGGAWITATGNPMATCAPSRSAYEFEGSEPTGLWTWRMQVTCDSGSSIYTPRYTPLEW